MPPLSCLQVTVLVPGGQEVEVSVPIAEDWNGRQLVEAALAMATEAGAAAPYKAGGQGVPEGGDSRPVKKHKVAV